MQLKAILNALCRHGSFVYDEVVWHDDTHREIDITVRPRLGSRPICSGCGERGPTHDHLATRRYQHVPLWGILVWLVYSSRRVKCPSCGVRVESIPWARGKERTTRYFQWFLASWARRWSWQETAQLFGTS